MKSDDDTRTCIDRAKLTRDSRYTEGSEYYSSRLPTILHQLYILYTEGRLSYVYASLILILILFLQELSQLHVRGPKILSARALL